MSTIVQYAFVLLTGLTVLSFAAVIFSRDRTGGGVAAAIARAPRLGMIADAFRLTRGAALLLYLAAQLVVPQLLYFWRPPVAALLFLAAAAAFAAVPVWTKQLLTHRRLREFEAQLPSFTDQLVSSVRGDVPLLLSLQDVVPSLAEPLRNEIATLAEQANKGQGGIETAIVNARRRYVSRNYALLLSIIQIFSRQGGNLIEPMQNMSRSFKEIYRLENKLRTAATNARTTFWMVNLGLLLIVIFVSIGQPQLLDEIFASGASIMLFLAGLLLYAGGTVWLVLMTRVEI